MARGKKKSSRSHVQHEKLPGLIGLIFEQKAQPIRSIKGRAFPGIGEALAEWGGEAGPALWFASGRFSAATPRGFIHQASIPEVRDYVKASLDTLSRG